MHMSTSGQSSGGSFGRPGTWNLVPADVRKHRGLKWAVLPLQFLSRISTFLPCSFLSMKTRILCRVLAALPDDLDPLPLDVREKWDLMELRQAYRSLHAPKTGEEAEEARRRRSLTSSSTTRYERGVKAGVKAWVYRLRLELGLVSQYMRLAYV
jgi:hypothetical protein